MTAPRRSSMDVVLCSPSRNASSLACANVDRSRACELHPDLAGSHEDRVVELLGQVKHTVLLRKLPDVLQNINNPVRLHDRSPATAGILAKVNTTAGEVV